MKDVLLLPVVIATLGLILADRVTAQTFTTLYSFTSHTPIDANGRGLSPSAGLIVSGNTLYGTVRLGGSSSNGTVFAVNTDGTGFTNLHSFTVGSGTFPYVANSDGAFPNAGLILSGNTLYGMTWSGGSLAQGTVFAVNTNGTGFTNLHSFDNFSDGAYPEAGLILSGKALYATTRLGGSSGLGTVFAINTDGTGFTTLHSFNADSGFPHPTNSDGVLPFGGLILSSNTLYGTALKGGSSGSGTLFAINTDGSGFTTLHSFTEFDSVDRINSDGIWPWAGLILSGNTLYGSASEGGSSRAGTLFKVNTDAAAFATLRSFDGSDGAFPRAGLILSGNTLYGTTQRGGSSWAGTVFAVNTDGTGFKTLHIFTAGSTNSSGAYTNSDGVGPCELILSGNTLYGATAGGGNYGSGTVFSITVPPQLAIIRSAADVILMWPTNAPGFNLQSTTNLVSPAVWNTVSPTPVVFNGQNAVTNPISGAQQFFWLSK